MTGELSATPVHPYVPPTKLNSFDQNFMKLCHIVKYHDIFFKFYNEPYCTMSSRVIALCSKYVIFGFVCGNMQTLQQRGHLCHTSVKDEDYRGYIWKN